jgi:hypothetical protein
MLKFASMILGACLALACTIGGANAQTHRGRPGLPPVTAENPPRDRQVGPPEPGPLKRYSINATTLYANDETGPDWPGSDEVFAVFTVSPPDGLAGAQGFTARTAVFRDFDTGERKSFDGSQDCLAGAVASQRRSDGTASAWFCHPWGVTGPVQVRVRLFEQDGILGVTLIGERVVQWSREEVQALQIGTGRYLEESVRIGGYTLTWRVRNAVLKVD